MCLVEDETDDALEQVLGGDLDGEELIRDGLEVFEGQLVEQAAGHVRDSDRQTEREIGIFLEIRLTCQEINQRKRGGGVK
jgi:hypothetical protein